MSDEQQIQLWEAAANGHTETALRALREGARINRETSCGALALCGCAANGHTATLSALLGQDADANLAQSHKGHGNTPLGQAAKWGHTEIVSALLQAGAVPSKRNRKGKSPRQLALEGEHPQTVAVLEQAEQAERQENLCLASQAGRTEEVLRLLGEGANPAQPGRGGKSPQQLALECQHPQTVAVLEQAERQENLCLASQAGRTEEVLRLLGEGANPAQPGRGGKMPVALASGASHTRTVQALVDARSLDLSAQRELVLGGARLGDGAVEVLLQQRLSAGCALVVLDLSANGLTRLPAEIRKLVNLQTLDLQENDLVELPFELTELHRLTDVQLGGNPRLQAVATIAEERGIPGVLDYLRDLNDDPQPTFKLKMLLVGPSMAGKTSLKNQLMGLHQALADADTERTIGLEIEPHVVLPDPQGRAPRGIVLVVYDAGGHDEYKEMQQVFVTPGTLNCLVWNLAEQERKGYDAQAFDEMVAQQVHWALLIQSCAPGSTVLMVGSHADEVRGDEAVVRSLCEAMAEAVHAELRQYHAAQERELAALSATQSRTETAEQRSRQLQRLLSQPLRLVMEAVAVSAKTSQGMEELHRRILGAAFDKQAFPTFGSKRPGTYDAIYRKLLRSHAQESSVGRAAMYQSAARQSELESSQLFVRFVGSKLSCEPDDDENHFVHEPEPGQDQDTDMDTDMDTEAGEQLRIVGTLQCESEKGGWSPEFVDKRVELSRAGVLTIEGREPADLTELGTTVGHERRHGRPFCVRIDCKDPVREYVLDMGNTELQQRWIAELARTAVMQATEHREYSFAVSFEGDDLKTFTIRYSSANEVHKMMQADGVVRGLTFPGSVLDACFDFMHTEENWRQRGTGMASYFTELIRRQEVVSHQVFKKHFNFNLAELVERHSRVPTKVRNDPELLRRAIRFLGITGEVLCPDYEHAPALAERVFLRPQWLVDVMKELVRHDLHEAVEKIAADSTINPVLMKELGTLFCTKGVLDRRLLPWLWRNLPFPLTQSEAEVSFVLELLTQLGLLTLLPHQHDPVWLLPLRLPSKDINATESVAMARAKFAAFLSRVGAVEALDGLDSVPISSLVETVSYIRMPDSWPPRCWPDHWTDVPFPTPELLQATCTEALAKADELLGEGPDPHALTRDDIGAIYLFTHNAIYKHLNAALRSQQRDMVLPFWGYIKLLQSALFKLPKQEQVGTVFRGVKEPDPPILLEDLKAAIASGEPQLWWPFSSTSTSLSAVKEFLGESRRVIFSIDSGSSARDVRRYSAYEDEDELLLPCGSAFVVKTAEQLAENLIMVKVAQTNSVLLQAEGTQAIAVPQSPAQHEALAQFANVLSTAAMDTVGRGYEFHQPLPAGLVAVAISGCAKLCGKQTSVWREAISTIVSTTDSSTGVELEVSMFQSGLSRIDFTARCAAGSHHDLCLQRMKTFEAELISLLNERWQGCTYTELCLGPDPQAGSIRMTTCQIAVERGEVVATVGGDEVSLVSLLGSAGVSRLDLEAQSMATTLQFFRAMGTCLSSSDFGSTGTCRRFCVELDTEIDRQLGGTFAEGYQWCTQLESSGLCIAATGEDLARVETEAVENGKSRACALLEALGRLYESSHLLLAASAGLSSMRHVLVSLCSPFAWFRAVLLRLVDSHGLHTIEAPEIAKALAVVAAVPEGVPPLQPHGASAPGPDPEPELEPELEPEPEPQL